MIGKLYLVATPIGNLEDITLRAIRILKEVDIIIAEDTRQTLKLLNHLKILKPLISYHRHNEEIKVDIIIEKIKNGNNIALVSDAGTPVISDPGEIIVNAALENNIEIISIPGPCALITGLIASGLDAKEFIFMGFLSLNKKIRKEKFEEIKVESKTIILYEAPHRLKKTLALLLETLGNRFMSVCRELTKKHETTVSGTISEVLAHFEAEEPRGECVLVIQGKNFAEIEKEELFGDRDLTYEVEKQKRGRFVLFTLKLNPGKITEIDRAFKIQANLLKYLFINCI